MQFTDICFVTKDVLRLRSFFEAVLGGTAMQAKFCLSEFFCLQSFTTYAIILLSSSMA